MRNPSTASITWHIIKTHKIYAAIFLSWNMILLARIPLGTFNDSSVLDVIAHFVLPATGTPLLYLVLEQIKLMPAMARTGELLVTIMLGVSLAVLWEIFEFTVDRTFGTDWQLNNMDTMTDLILGLLGTIFGTVVFMRIYKSKG